MLIDINLDCLEKIKNKKNISSIINYLVQIGYNHVFLNEQNNLSNDICNKIKDDLLISNSKIDDIDNIIKKLFGLSSSSNKKGEITENIIYEIFKNNYKNYCYEKKRSIAHNADGELISPSGLKALIEIKNYENTVNKDEIDKFKYDLEFTNTNFGIFISIKSGIVGYKYFDLETYISNNKEYHIIYISTIYENENLLDSAIMLIEKIYSTTLNNKTIKTLQYNNLKHNLNELNTIIERTRILNSKYLNLETIIKTSFNDFYQEFRNYELDLNNKIKLILNNIEENVENIYLNINDNKNDILNKCKDDKCFIIISKLFEILKDYNIVINDNSIWHIVKNKKIFGKIKKYKDKLNIELDDSIKICLNKKNFDKNLNMIQNII